MDGSFACPECGSELVLKGLSPGRQVRCGWCETWVEVPFLPRAGVLPRSRRFRKSAKWVTWGWRGLGVLAVLVVMFGAARFVRWRGRENAERVVAELTASAKALEGEGQFDQARDEVEKALAEAAKLEPGPRERLDALRHERDRLSKRSAEARFAAAAGAPPAQAIAEGLALRTLAARDPALSDLQGKIAGLLERTRRAWAESDAVAARRAADAGRAGEALDLCTRFAKNAAEIDDKAARTRLLSLADELVTGIIARQGVVLEPARGQFSLGSARAYDGVLHPLLDDVLRRRGYFPRPGSSHWSRLWDSHAPYRVTIEVAEGHEGTYLQSVNRLSVIRVTANLSLHGSSCWHAGPLIVRSPSPLPSLPAYQAGRLAVSDQHDEAFERLLYDKARQALVDKFSWSLRSLPPLGPPPSLTSNPAA